MKCEMMVGFRKDRLRPCGQTANWEVQELQAPSPAVRACPAHLIDAIDERMTAMGVKVKEIIT